MIYGGKTTDAKKSDIFQAEKFEQAARDLGYEDNDEKFKDVLRKLTKPKH